ncbi:DUF262 domain-containing protein [Bacillus cereus]|uniref:DUF262 domain-containing protein n=1 Tax=Bacillus cereus TaxID=1396 RepID=UPI0010BD91AB|nr:DUF262 domain-containing protein [Bacillus cereus]TKI26310.1 DUF262 domain-containing protein [Bacillus cereus]
MSKQNGVVLNRRTNNITISEFYENHLLDKYNYEPDYQRKGNVWSIEKQSFLIDSLMKNYPIPPIFLHTKTDVSTGKTKYFVIDGKQRLSAIVKFINNEIYLPENFGDDKFGDEKLNGLKFNEIGSDSEYKNNFWKYSIPIEYVDTEDKGIVNRIFDRLNRNGEPLNDQELRNAKYNNSKLIETVRDLAGIDFWKIRLGDVVETFRMEDDEFISELMFTLLEDSTIDAKPITLDLLYEKWDKGFNKTPNLKDDVSNRFKEITQFLTELEINYEEYKIKGVSHLYGLWGFAIYCIKHSISPIVVKDKLDEFFKLLRSGHLEIKEAQLYKNSMSYSTKSKGQREKRINSLIKFCI